LIALSCPVCGDFRVGDGERLGSPVVFGVVVGVLLVAGVLADGPSVGEGIVVGSLLDRAVGEGIEVVGVGVRVTVGLLGKGVGEVDGFWVEDGTGVGDGGIAVSVTVNVGLDA
jgi:hypothetical protein